MEFGDLSDNPFSIDLARAGRSKRAAVKSAVKLLVVVAAGFAATLAVTRYTPQWLVQRYTNDFDSLPSEEKRRRLIQIADLGPVAIDPLVQAMAEDDALVASTAYELLTGHQNDWTVLSANQLKRCQGLLVASIQDVAVHLPDDRTGWASTLLQDTIRYSVNRRDHASRQLYQEANRALELLAISDRAGPSILSDEPLDPREPRRLVVRSNPLPVQEVAQGRWTDWPPPSSAPDSNSSDEIPASQLQEPQSPVGQPAESELAEKPSVYRSSSARLRPVDSSQPVILHDIDPTGPQGPSSLSIQQATALVDAPMGTLDDRSVMHWLASEHRELRNKARDELVSRGYSEQDIGLATQLFSGDRQTRLALIDAIARADQIDPRPWLLMLLGDENRDVKLRAISVLGTMNDPDIQHELRVRMTDERDPMVAARIRRVLDLR